MSEEATKLTFIWFFTGGRSLHASGMDCVYCDRGIENETVYHVRGPYIKSLLKDIYKIQLTEDRWYFEGRWRRGEYLCEDCYGIFNMERLL